jgi:hypothetical protein
VRKDETEMHVTWWPLYVFTGMVLIVVALVALGEHQRAQDGDDKGVAKRD